jgi:hypothetical protein
MGEYGTLPVTGLGVLSVGAIAIGAPLLAAISAGVIVGGFLLLRLARPKKVELRR